ncbi:MAG: tetratricopeptide repeat protein [Terracidiphilus sp.]
MTLQRRITKGLSTASLAAAIPLAAAAQSATTPQNPAQSLAAANAALQAGEADKALSLLSPLPSAGPGIAMDHNLICRVRYTLAQWDAAAAECEQAAQLDPQNSDFHLWLGRALGEKASRASFLTAFSLAKRTRAEFEEAVRINPRNAEALADLGDFYRQAPGVVGGGIDKAEAIASRLDKVDPVRAHELHGQIAEQQKDYPGAEDEYRKTITAGAHPAIGWATLASFYARRQRFDEMEPAVASILSTALHDKHPGSALYDGAGLLIETNRSPALAATMLEDYLAGSSKTEEAPAFIAHLRLARLKQQLGDQPTANRERSAALALAHEYKPAQESLTQSVTR